MKNKFCKITRQLNYKLTFWVLLLVGGASQALAEPRLEDPVWRAQLRITVANVPDAGTDDSVFISLVMGQRYTGVDTTETDFVRNRTYLYDLDLSEVKTLEQASRGFAIDKYGKDDLCIKTVALILNGQAVFEKTFLDEGVWIGRTREEGVFSQKDLPFLHFSQEVIRNHPLWRAYEQPAPPTVLRRAEIERGVEMFIGSALAGWRVLPFIIPSEPSRLPINWGQLRNRRYIEIASAVDRQGKSYFNVDLDLAVPGANPELDVDFELHVTCDEGRFRFTASNFIVRHIKRNRNNDKAAQQITASIREFADYLTLREMGFALTLSSQATCNEYTIHVRKTGDVHFVAAGTAPTFTDEPSNEPAGDTRDTNRRATGGSVNDAETEDALQARSAHIKLGALSEKVAYSFSLTPAAEDRSEVQIQIELPAGVTAPETLVTASDAGGTRSLGVQLSKTNGGGTLVTFTDTLAAGEATHYLVPVRFDEKSPEESFIATKVSGAALPAPLAFQTGFKIANGKVFPLGTVQE